MDQVVGKADLDVMKCSRLFHTRALQWEAAGSCHPALMRETLNPHCIAHGGDLKYDRGCSQDCRGENCEGAETEEISSPCKMPKRLQWQRCLNMRASIFSVFACVWVCLLMLCCAGG